jgi:hypothetical protein
VTPFPTRLLPALAAVFLIAAAEAQQSAPAPVPAAPAAKPAPVPPALQEWVGTWSGSAKLTNEGAAGTCIYESGAKPPAVTLDLKVDGEVLRGTVKLAFPALQVPGCPAIDRVAEARDLMADGSSLAFSGPGKNAWTLGRRSRELLGTVAFAGGAAEEGALHLSGEVKLAKDGSGKHGSMTGTVGAILGANIVGLGAFAAANKLGQGKNNVPPQVNCSPRQCLYISPTDPCQCNTPTVAGGTCGTTTSGVAYAGLCNVDGGLPCQAGLSCNSGFCEDRFGHCPF